MKCTDLITGHGSASAVQCAPPSVVASSEAVPTAQPSCPLTKSTEVRLSLPDSCRVQWAPPSAVARIVSWLTAQPRDGDTNCRPSMAGGSEAACAPAQELPCAGAPAAAPGADAPADAEPAAAEPAGPAGAAEGAPVEVAAAAALPAADPPCPPAAETVPVSHPATTTERAAKAS